MQWNLYSIVIVSKSMKVQANELISYSFFAENKDILQITQIYPISFSLPWSMLITLSFHQELRHTGSIVFFLQWKLIIEQLIFLKDDYA